MKFLSNVLKTFSTLSLHAKKKKKKKERKDKFRTVFQNVLFISQFMNCFHNSPSEKQN